MHGKAKAGTLPPAEHGAYLAQRDELARMMLAAQKLTLKPGERPREALRMARALPLTIEHSRGTERTTSLDLSVGGFGTIVGARVPAGETVKFTMKMPEGAALVGTARVMHAVAHGGTRISCAFVGLADADKARLETLVFDAVLSSLTI